MSKEQRNKVKFKRYLRAIQEAKDFIKDPHTEYRVKNVAREFLVFAKQFPGCKFCNQIQPTEATCNYRCIEKES